MARFVTLASSSSGNCTYVGTATHGILIDAGISNKRICDRLNSLGISPDCVKAVFLTHEHYDHTSGLRVFAEKHYVPVYATGGTLSALSGEGKLTEKMNTIKLPPETVQVEDIKVDYFYTSHDAKQSCGYIITLPDRKIGVATDIGIMTDEIKDKLRDCDLCLLESNYDEDMLRFGPYTAQLKNRIRSDVGHMSNDTCAETVLWLLGCGVRRFVLGHLSRENNTPELAKSCTNSILKHRGYVPGEDYLLEVAPVDCMNRLIRF